jgi:DNA-binding NtrC family response regulator
MLPGFACRSAAARKLADMARRAAARATAVLVTGESGVGKSHLARCIHDLARGPGAPFVIIDCANLPEGLAENELFGHEVGAYSGATTRQPGKFEAADHGTALLDRASDLPPDVQGKLLRVLQERSFERVGGQVTVRVDILVIATAGPDLADLVARRLFREDLYYRLHVVHLEVPPLRERPEDIGMLAELFLERCAVRTGRSLSFEAQAVALLERQSWMGNVRELQNVVERAAILAEAGVISSEDLEPALVSLPRSPQRAIAELAEARLPFAEIERLYIERVLAQVGGRVGQAAEILGIHRKTLLEKRKRYGLM